MLEKTMYMVTASWCSSCKMIKPKVEATALRYNVPLVMLDVDQKEVRDFVEVNFIMAVPQLVFIMGNHFEIRSPLENGAIEQAFKDLTS
jgi:thiol-disulfide isomerase/thioredoxin